MTGLLLCEPRLSASPQECVARFLTAVGLVRVVPAVVLSVADEGRKSAKPRPALEAAWLALKLSCHGIKRSQYIKGGKKQ